MNDYIKNLEASQMKESVDEFNVGDTVKVHNRIKEGNKERIQIFEGTVVKRQGGSNRETFTVRKILADAVLRRHGLYTHLSLRRLKL